MKRAVVTLACVLLAACTSAAKAPTPSPPSRSLTVPSNPGGPQAATLQLTRDFASVQQALRRDHVFVATSRSLDFAVTPVSETQAIAKVYPNGQKDVIGIVAYASGQASWSPGQHLVWLVLGPSGWVQVWGCPAVTPPDPCPRQYQFEVSIVDAHTDRFIMGTNVSARTAPTPPSTPSSVGPSAPSVAGLGTISGHLFAVGGPAPGSPRPLSGTVTITGDGRSTRVSVGSDGAFSTALPAVLYQLTGTSPAYNGGKAPCDANSPVTVKAGVVSVEDIYCQEK